MFDNRLALYITTDPPLAVWRTLANRFSWHLVHHDDMRDALGAYITLLPSVIIVDQTCAVGQAAFEHLADVLPDAVQSQILLITVNHSYAISCNGGILHIDIPAVCQTEVFIDHQLQKAQLIWENARHEVTRPATAYESQQRLHTASNATIRGSRIRRSSDTDTAQAEC